MAHHSITVRNVTDGGTGSGGNSTTSVRKKYKKTSAKENWFMKKRGQFTEAKRELRNLAFLELSASLAAVTVASSAIRSGVNIYSNFMEAKSGEQMKYHNMRQGVKMITQPFQFAKTAIWDYGVIAPMRINRQNEMLNYNRQLTGNLIHSKIYEGR